MGWKKFISEAISRREEILQLFPEAVRLIHSRSEKFGDLSFSKQVGELPCGVTVDLFGENLLITAYYEGFNCDEIVAAVRNYFPIKAAYYQPRYEKGIKKPILIYGVCNSPFTILESGLKFEIDLTRGLNIGLFLDTRPVRSFLKNGGAKDKRVLNQFSYTCALGVAALSGGATSVVNIDSSKSAIERGRTNYKLNSLKIDSRGFVRSDLIKKLKYWSKRGVEFDLIIMDPPPWFPGKGPAVRVYPLLLKWSLTLLAPGGKLLAICREPSMSFNEFKELLGREGERILPHADIWPEKAGDPLLKIFLG